ncbi:hypothetical protein [Streptomyces noursei]|uniref:hypothetical protein n=1 Tax=Streptomyces noursei TaxID=1971 RepID=UPI0030F1E57C
MNTRIWARTESGNLWHAFTEDGEGPALCHSRIWARMFARMNDDFRTREGAESPLTTRCERCVAKFEALLAEATVEHTPAPAEAAEEAVDGPTFTEQAGVRYAVIGKGKRVHYSPSNDDGLCGRAITAYLDVEDAVALFDKGYELCAPCHRAAEKRAEARRLADTSPLAAAATEVAETVDVVDTEREAALDRLADDVAQLHTEADTLLADIREAAAEADQLADEIAAWGAEVDAVTERPVVEGVVVAHGGTAEGSTPSDASHPDVVAARAALDGLRPAPLTDSHDTSEPTGDECNVRGYVIEPRGHGRVALYWLEGGRAVRHDDGWHGPCLDILADKMQRSGWITVKMLRSSLCVFADRPAEDAKPAAVGQDVEQPAPAAPAPFRSGDRVVCGDGNVRTVEGMAHRTNEPARVVVAGGAEWIASECSAVPACLHRNAPRPDVSGDPIKTCARKQLNQDAGVFSDEGCVEAYDCAVQAANRAAEMNAEEDAPAGDPVYVWDLLCVEHRDSEQQVDTCEECNAAEDQADATAAELLDTVDAVEEAERADGTWRGGWIASAPADGALFDLGPDEQGALFT